MHISFSVKRNWEMFLKKKRKELGNGKWESWKFLDSSIAFFFSLSFFFFLFSIFLWEIQTLPARKYTERWGKREKGIYMLINHQKNAYKGRFMTTFILLYGMYFFYFVVFQYHQIVYIFKWNVNWHSKVFINDNLLWDSLNKKWEMLINVLRVLVNNSFK